MLYVWLQQHHTRSLATLLTPSVARKPVDSELDCQPLTALQLAVGPIVSDSSLAIVQRIKDEKVCKLSHFNHMQHPVSQSKLPIESTGVVDSISKRRRTTTSAASMCPSSKLSKRQTILYSKPKIEHQLKLQLALQIPFQSSTSENYKLVMFEDKCKGKCVRTTEIISAGSYVLEYRGELLCGDQIRQRDNYYEHLNQRQCYLMFYF